HQQVLARAEEAQALRDGRETGAWCVVTAVVFGELRRQPPYCVEDGAEGQRVETIGPGETQGPDEQAAEQRPDGQPGLEAELAECVGGRQQLTADQSR